MRSIRLSAWTVVPREKFNRHEQSKAEQLRASVEPFCSSSALSLDYRRTSLVPGGLISWRFGVATSGPLRVIPSHPLWFILTLLVAWGGHQILRHASGAFEMKWGDKPEHGGSCKMPAKMS